MLKFFIAAAFVVVLAGVGSTEGVSAQHTSQPIYEAALSHLKDSEAIPPEWVFRLAVSSRSEESEREQIVAAAAQVGVPVVAKESAFSCPPEDTPITECSLPEAGSALALLYKVILGAQGTKAVVKVVLYKQSENADKVYGEGWSLELTKDTDHGRWTVTDAVQTYIT